MSSPSASRAPTTAGIHWVCPWRGPPRADDTLELRARRALLCNTEAGMARRRRPPTTDTTTSCRDRCRCNFRIAGSPCVLPRSDGLDQGLKTGLNTNTGSDLEGRAFRTRDEPEGQIAGPSTPSRCSRAWRRRESGHGGTDESSGPGHRGERDRVPYRAVPPSNPLLVLLGRVLRVVDEQVRAAAGRSPTSTPAPPGNSRSPKAGS